MWLKGVVLCAVLFGSSLAFSADLPGGFLRTAENLPPSTYELLVSPSYRVSGDGAYLTSELRYQPLEMIGVGAGFGAGETGLSFGVNGTWYLFTHSNVDPEVAILGGLYFNRVEAANYFVLKLAPTVSRTFYLSWGEFVPYAAAQLSPSFRLGDPANQLSVKGATGIMTSIRSLEGLRFLTEFSWGLLNSSYEVSFAIAYPFVAL